MRNRGRVAIGCLVATLLLVGCGRGSAPAATTPSGASTPTPSAVTPTATVVTPTPNVVTPTAPATPERTTAHIDVNGRARSYVVVVPSDVSTRGALPLLLMLHGPNVTTAEAESIGGADELARDPGAVLVWAEAYRDRWNAGTCCFLPNTAPSDVAFIRALIGRLEAAYPIDPARVFIGGDGTGGAMAYRAACEVADLFAAAAVVGADAELLVDCSPARPIPVLQIYGSDDKVSPPDEGGNACDGPCPSVAQTMERWRQADACTGEPTTTTEGIVVTTTFSTCGAGVEVQFVKANGLDDTWLGPGIDDLAVIWAFLMNHARTASGSTG